MPFCSIRGLMNADQGHRHVHLLVKPPSRVAKLAEKWPGKEVKASVGTRTTVVVKGRSWEVLQILLCF